MPWPLVDLHVRRDGNSLFAAWKLFEAEAIHLCSCSAWRELTAAQKAPGLCSLGVNYGTDCSHRDRSSALSTMNQCGTERGLSKARGEGCPPSHCLKWRLNANMPTVFQMQPGPCGHHLNREIKEYLTTEYCANPAKYIQPALSWPCSEQAAGCRPAELPSHPVCLSFMDTLLGHKRRTAPGRARLCYSSNWWEIALCLLRLPPGPTRGWPPALPPPLTFPTLLSMRSKLAGLAVEDGETYCTWNTEPLLFSSPQNWQCSISAPDLNSPTTRLVAPEKLFWPIFSTAHTAY